MFLLLWNEKITNNYSENNKRREIVCNVHNCTIFYSLNYKMSFYRKILLCVIDKMKMLLGPNLILNNEKTNCKFSLILIHLLKWCLFQLLLVGFIFLRLKDYCSLFTVLFPTLYSILWSQHSSSYLANVSLCLSLYTWVMPRLLTLPGPEHLLHLFLASQTMCLCPHRLWLHLTEKVNL